MRTWLTERFGIDVPVVSAPMGGVAGGELAAAVSRAGALGMVGASAATTPEWLADACLVAAGSALPFGVGLQAWALEGNPGQLDAALASDALLVSVSYGPYAGFVPRLRSAGKVVATTVATLAEARAAEAAGVDVIVARGLEGGGHGGNDVATLPLLQAVLDAVSIPVLAAGGIATSRGLAAVVAAGAAGAWVGTAFLTCAEATVLPGARERLIDADGTDTVYGRVFDIGARTQWPAEFGERALRNQYFDAWVGREDELARDDDAAERMRRAHRDDDYDTLCVDAGQGVGLLSAVVTAAEVVTEFSEADALLRHAAGC